MTLKYIKVKNAIKKINKKLKEIFFLKKIQEISGIYS